MWLLKATKEKLQTYIWGHPDPPFDSGIAILSNPNETSGASNRQPVNRCQVRVVICLFLVLLIMCVMLLLLASALTMLSGSLLAHANTYDSWEENVLKYARQYDAEQCLLIPDGEKIDCAPSGEANEQLCTKRKCCWGPKSVNDSGVEQRVGVPWCYYPPLYGGYSSGEPIKTDTGFTVEMQRKFKSQFKKDIQIVKMDFKMETSTRLHVKITDPKHARFEPPYPEVPRFYGPVSASQDYDVMVKQGSSGFNVIRKKTQESIFKALDVGDLVYSDQYIEISGILPKGSALYGLGDQISRIKLNDNESWKLITLFNHDRTPQENVNLYGSHPFYLAVEPSGNSHGFFLLNSNAMDIIISPNPAITFRTIGGVLDMYFFLGPTPADVIRQYAEVVGTPAMPPYWSLGFHLCRFGYKSLNRTQEVWKQTRDAGIPFDTQWNDIDYMDSYNDFSYDKVRFAGLPDFVKKLHEVGMHWVPIMDPGVSASEPAGSYRPYDQAVKQDVLIKDNKGKTFIAKVWNKVSTAFPDFTNPHAVSYWTDMLKMFHDQVPFDGLWIDMNEPSNFYSGTASGCPSSSLETPEYTPHVEGGRLSYLTLCMTAKQYIGNHYDAHNLYGFSEAIATTFALRQFRKKRPFVISRSTFPGHGHFAGHWTGDISSSWEDMKKSIPHILSFGMFQIPLVGADICGFNGNTTAPLCLRWSQLGAFYPFSRNHNTDDAFDQDPVSLGPAVANAARDALNLRYTLLPYLYTLFYNAHMTGDTVARPVFFEFYQDKNTLTIGEQFLWGKWLLIAPVLEEGATQVKPYLPKGVWFRFPGGKRIESNGTQVTLDAPTTSIPLLIRGGGILPLQQPAATTALSRMFPFDILVAPDSENKAEGELYWDDGDSLNVVENGKYLLYKFALEKNTLRGAPEVKGYNETMIKSFTIYGVPKNPERVTFNGEAIKMFQYNDENQVLRIDHLTDPGKSFSLEWT